MSQKQCPLCGNLIEDDGLFCADCNENAKNRVSLDLLEEETELRGDDTIVLEEIEEEDKLVDEESEVFVPAKKKNKKLIVLLSAILILCIVGGVFFYIENKNETERQNIEMALWFLCIEENTPAAYSKYLNTYPAGRFREDAQMKITDLRKLESENWQTLKQSGDINDYYSFLSKYPDTPFRNDIKYLMDSLSWNIAQKENTADSYKAYLENHDLGNISGNYSSIAKGRYDYLRQLRKIEGEELKKVQELLSDYFKALSNQKYAQLADLFAPIVSNFYGMKNNSSAAIIKSVQKDIQQKSIKTLTYTPDLESLSIMQDSTGLYFADNLKVVKALSYKTKKAKEATNELLRIELSPDLKIQGMFINTP